MVVHHDIRPVYIKINIYIYMYVNYSTEGSTALLDQAKLSLLVWVLCSVICLFLWLVLCGDSTSASPIALYYGIVFLINGCSSSCLPQHLLLA